MDYVDKCSFRVPGRPVAKQRPRTDYNNPHVYTPDKTLDYERHVRECCRPHRPDGWDREGLYEIRIRAVYPDAQIGDGDNILKSIEDGLNECLYDDDRQVRRGSYQVEVDSDTEDGYVDVSVLQLGRSWIERLSEKVAKWVNYINGVD
ncbi:MAG: RusA family crossover junction endodeoxyribonuclease [Bradymonadaceae bacterium]